MIDPVSPLSLRYSPTSVSVKVVQIVSHVADRALEIAAEVARYFLRFWVYQYQQTLTQQQSCKDLGVRSKLNIDQNLLELHYNLWTAIATIQLLLL